MAYIEITRQTFLNGEPAYPGEVYEVDEQTAKDTVKYKKGKIVDAPEGNTPAEPAKPKVTKVSTKKSAPES